MSDKASNNRKPFKDKTPLKNMPLGDYARFNRQCIDAGSARIFWLCSIPTIVHSTKNVPALQPLPLGVYYRWGVGLPCGHLLAVFHSVIYVMSAVKMWPKMSLRVPLMKAFVRTFLAKFCGLIILVFAHVLLRKNQNLWGKAFAPSAYAPAVKDSTHANKTIAFVFSKNSFQQNPISCRPPGHPSQIYSNLVHPLTHLSS